MATVGVTLLTLENTTFCCWVVKGAPPSYRVAEEKTHRRRKKDDELPVREGRNMDDMFTTKHSILLVAQWSRFHSSKVPQFFLWLAVSS